jgi:hypothetical protein
MTCVGARGKKRVELLAKGSARFERAQQAETLTRSSRVAAYTIVVTIELAPYRTEESSWVATSLRMARALDRAFSRTGTTGPGNWRLMERRIVLA